MKGFVSAARTRLRRLVGADEPPGRFAAAWGLGVAISLSPLLGLHTWLALLLAFILRLNKVDTLLGTLLINPWTLPPYFAMSVVLGGWITGINVPRPDLPPLDLLLSLKAWGDHGSWLKPLYINWFVGASAISPVGGVLTYSVLRRLVERRRRLKQHPSAQ